MKKRMIAAAVIVFMIGGFFMYRHFIVGQVTDGPIMENSAGPMLELLNAQWMSEDSEWSAWIDDYKLDLSYRQELVYRGNFFFDFQGDDLNIKTKLSFDHPNFESEDGSVSSTMESFYVENQRLYLDITLSKAGEASVRQQAVLDRAESGKSAESELGEIREVSELAELVEFSWHQSAMSFSDCFDFEIKFTEQDPDLPRLCCEYTDWATGERIKLGEEDSGFQGFSMVQKDPEAQCGTWPTVPLERWAELADFLRKAELSPYRPPDPNLLDATNSIIEVTWQDGGEEFTNRYDGHDASDLRELLRDIAEEVSTSK